MNIGVMLHHSNASSHSETITTEYLEQKKHKTRAANTRKKRFNPMRKPGVLEIDFFFLE